MARRKKRLTRRLEAATKSRKEAATPPPSFRPVEAAEPPVELAAFVGAAIIGLLLIAGLATLFGIRKIETTLETRTLALLRSEGLKDIEVDADGLDITLVGTVRDEAHIALAIAIGHAIEGVENVDAENVIFVPVSLIEFEAEVLALAFSWSSDGMTVGGTVSNEATRDTVVASLGTNWSAIDAIGLVVEEEAPSERDWLPSILQVVSRVGEDLVEGLVIANSGSSFVLVNGELEERSQLFALRRDIEEILSALTFTFTNGLKVKEVPPPPTTAPVGTVVAAPTTTVPPEVIELQQTLDELIEGKVVEFAFGSSTITAEGRALLDEVLEALRMFPDVPVEIAGHTDNVGSNESNLLLSRLRAAAVLSYLVNNGQEASRFVVIGYGESDPVADNATPAGRARNRRIEFIALSE